MKTKFVMLAAAIAATQFVGAAAFAQSSTTSTIAAPTAADAPAAVGSSVATAPAAKPPVGISYLGIYYGPGFSNELDGKTYGGDVQFLNNRPSIKYNINENTDVGVQARFNVTFAADGLDAMNDPWRIFSNIKNVYKDDVYQFNLLPRIYLPTKLSHHDQGMLPSPEFMPILNITPKNSRFNLSIYPQLLRPLYKNNATATAIADPTGTKGGALNFVALGNFEGTYQLTGSTAITFGFYPEYIAKTARALYNDSNELDLGVSVDVAKGWSVNPFVATEFVGMGAKDAAISKNMALNMAITGTFL